jgi:hypothetical protein
VAPVLGWRAALKKQADPLAGIKGRGTGNFPGAARVNNANWIRLYFFDQINALRFADMPFLLYLMKQSIHLQ